MASVNCPKCGDNWTPREKAYKSRRSGLTTKYADKRCSRCEALRQRERRVLPVYQYKVARSIAVRRGLKWDIGEEYYLQMRRLGCVYCGFPLPRTGMGIDRIDTKIGYIPGNVVPCCAECNIAKNASFTYNEMMIVGKAIAAIKRQRRENGEPDHKFGRKQKYAG